MVLTMDRIGNPRFLLLVLSDGGSFPIFLDFEFRFGGFWRVFDGV